jgi:flagellar export protein FliJ
MTAFRFRLEKVLALRRKQLEVEDAKLQMQIAALAELDRGRAQLEAAAIRCETEVRNWSPVAGQELAALSRYHAHMQVREKDIAVRRRKALQEVEAQRQTMLEARRRCRLLERLEQRHRAEWQAAADREWEMLAAESHLARLPRPR